MNLRRMTYQSSLHSAVGAARSHRLTGGVMREFKDIESCGER